MQKAAEWSLSSGSSLQVRRAGFLLVPYSLLALVQLSTAGLSRESQVYQTLRTV
jgi:hypothetical protein